MRRLEQRFDQLLRYCSRGWHVELPRPSLQCSRLQPVAAAIGRSRCLCSTGTFADTYWFDGKSLWSRILPSELEYRSRCGMVRVHQSRISNGIKFGHHAQL